MDLLDSGWVTSDKGAVAMTHTVARHECQMVTELKGTVRVVRVSGRLDWATAGRFRDRMRDEWRDDRLIVDLSHMAAIDSAGTGVVLAAAVRARHRGQHLVIVSLDPVLIEVLSSLGPSVPVVNSQAQAWRVLCAPTRPGTRT
jgi:anti-anti-sigma factor